jgi:hypothetical protein
MMSSQEQTLGTAAANHHLTSWLRCLHAVALFLIAAGDVRGCFLEYMHVPYGGLHSQESCCSVGQPSTAASRCVSQLAGT